MSQLGQNRKSSTRANVFRFAPESGHRAMQSACPFRANNRLMHRSDYQLYSITSSARATALITPAIRLFGGPPGIFGAT
jgi:hypothetical protein